MRHCEGLKLNFYMFYHDNISVTYFISYKQHYDDVFNYLFVVDMNIFFTFSRDSMISPSKPSL